MLGVDMCPWRVEEEAVLNEGQGTSAVLQLNSGQVAAAFITDFTGNSWSLFV